VQQLARFPSFHLRSDGRVEVPDFGLLRDRRQAHHLPLLLAEHVAYQVIQMQALHDDDDGPVLLVVEAAVQRVVVPGVGRHALGIRQGPHRV
jgi:hypothetical protein